MRRLQATVKPSSHHESSNLVIYQSWPIRNFGVVELASFVLMVMTVSALLTVD